MEQLKRENLRYMTISFMAIAALLIGPGCGEEAEKSDANRTKTVDPKGDPKDPKDPGTDDNGTDDSSDGKDPGDMPPAVTQLTGKKVWELKIHPMLEESCKGCHADPRFPKEKDGPLTIYTYDKMQALLKDGSSVDNALLRKVSGLNHEGGNRCIGGLEVDPCKSMIEWYKAEFGDDGAKPKVIEDPNAVSSEPGDFTLVTSLGKVFGWAVNKTNLDEKITVKIYVDGDKDAGELAGSVNADQEGPDGNHKGNHQFTFELPEKFRDKSVRSMYLYGIIGGQETLLKGPFAFVAYAYSEAGKAYFNQNVEPKLTACKSCHAVSYTNQFASLIFPTPDKTGTKTNNQLINKAGTRNGTGHGGGNQCGSGSPCTEFEEWWKIEFGN